MSGFCTIGHIYKSYCCNEDLCNNSTFGIEEESKSYLVPILIGVGVGILLLILIIVVAAAAVLGFFAYKKKWLQILKKKVQGPESPFGRVGPQKDQPIKKQMPTKKKGKVYTIRAQFINKQCLGFEQN